MIGFTTVREGDRVALWDAAGRARIVDGPARVWARGKTLQVLPRYSAGPDEYLVVRLTDGHTQHVHGPAAVWLNPVEHASVKVEKAVGLDANEAVVVYAQGPDRVGRRVVRGPGLFMPAANEWLHEFSWHGAPPEELAGRTHHGEPKRKVPHALRFRKLRVIPDQTYFDVQDVRTADDALIVVQVMIFFELADIERMLDQTHDPVADFINAVTADVIDFAASRTFERFKEETGALNELATYRQLAARAQRIGYAVSKVVYRGYTANPKLQSMHEGAIEARTQLHLEAETEEQAQMLADLKLNCEAERAVKRRELEMADVEHQTHLQRLAHEEHLRRQRADREARLEAKRAAREMALAHLRAKREERLALLQSMHDMQVDLTRYLVSRRQHPDRLIRIDGSNGHVPRVHVHESAG
jgi:hypothetical protein